MTNQIPPVQSNQQLVDPQTGFGRPPFILLINNLINQIVSNATGLISTFFATKPSGTAPIRTSGTYGDGVTISLEDSGVSPGTYGDATHVPQITLDGHGLITSVVPVTITGGGGGKPWYWSPPLAGDFTIVANQQNMTLTDNGDVGLLVNGGVPSVNQQFMGKTAPNSDWSVTTHFNNVLLSSISFSAIGLALVDPALSKITWLAALDARNDIRSENWTFPATFSSEPAETDLTIFTAAGMFIRATYTLSTSMIVVEISADGKQWTTHMTLNVSSWLGAGPYNVGFTTGYTRSSGIGTTGNVDMWLQSW